MEVWRKWANSKMDGECFSCCNSIKIEKWHCGHILPYVRGGLNESVNLRPVCVKCNLGMSSMHMYEYIIKNKLLGLKHLPKNDPIVKKYTMMNEAVIVCEEKINYLYCYQVYNRIEMNDLKNKIISKRLTDQERIVIMEKIGTDHKKLRKEQPK